MPKYDYYDSYRPALTDEDNSHIRMAGVSNEDLFHRIQQTAPDWKPEENRGLGTFIGPDGRQYHNQVTLVHVEIATRQAEAQLKEQGLPLPEEEEITLRFPGVSPVGKYSIIDMKLAQRLNDIEGEKPFTSPQITANIEALKMTDFYKNAARNAAVASQKHRVLSRAAKLCRDEEGSQVLHGQARALEYDPSVIRMNQILEGMEYLQGRRQTVSQEVMDLYKNNMSTDLAQARRTMNTMAVTPSAIDVKFENFEDILTQRAFSNPQNWNKNATWLKAGIHTPAEVGNAVQPYAIASAMQALKPAFTRMQEQGLDLRDLLIVDGKTVQERLDEMGVGNLSKAAAEVHAASMVATALMSGKRVETFIPDQDGKIPDQPTAVTKKGYAPENSGPVVLSTWERFCAKLGFYKEKVAQAEEYKQAMAARDRVPANIDKRTAQEIRSSVADTKKMFFGGLEKELSELPTHFGAHQSAFRNISRTSPTSVCICALAIDHPLEDILDPNKLQAEKQAIAQRYIQEAKTGNAMWLGDVLAEGTLHLENKIEALATKTDFNDPVQRAKVLPMMCAATRAGYDIYQDVLAKGNDDLMQYYADNRVEVEADLLREANRRNGEKFHYPYPEDRMAYAEKSLDRLRRVHALCNAMENGVNARATLQKPELTEGEAKTALAHMVVGDMAIKAINKEQHFYKCAFHTPAQMLFTDQLMHNGEVGKIAKAVVKDPNARLAMVGLAGQKSMDEVLQVNTAKALTNPKAHGGVEKNMERIANDTKVTLTEHLNPVLNQKAPQAGMTRR